MIRRTVKIQLLVFALISVVGIVYTGVTYVGIDKRYFSKPYSVMAELSESGGIFPGAEVTYRGVAVGRVGSLDLRPEGIAAEMEIDKGVEIPADVDIIVQNKSAVGEQYIDLLPRNNKAPYLKEGDTIERDRAETPIPPEELLLNLDRLVNSVPRGDLTTVIDELGKAFIGAETSLQRLVDSGNQLTEAATAALPETIRLIEDGQTVLATQNDNAGNIKSFAEDLASLSATLRSSDGDLRRLITNGNQSSVELTDFIESNRQNIGLLAGNLVTFAQINQARLPALEQILVTYPVVTTGGFTVVPGDGTSHFGLVTQSDPPPCKQGYESTERRSPFDGREIGANMKAHCTLSKDDPSDYRGSRNAPQPPSSNYGFGTTPQAEANAAARSPYTSYSSGSGGSAAKSGSTSQSKAGATSESRRFAAYDPITGVVYTGDGQRLTIGSTGGQQRVLGEDSWKWLLIGPLSD